MRSLSHEEAELLESKQSEKMQSGVSSGVGKLLEKYHDDFYVVNSNKVYVAKNASPRGTGKLRSPGVTILNYSLDEINTVAEHSFYYPSKPNNEKARSEPCLDFGAQDTNCPICKAAKQKFNGAKFPSIRMALTVLMDRLDDSGNIIGYDKKLLVVKGENRKKFYELISTAAMNNNGSIRGVRFLLERGNGDTSPSSGTPVVPMDGTPAYSFVGEEWLSAVQQSIQPTEVRSSDNKYLKKPANWLTTPVNINQNMDILNYSSEEDLRKEFDPSYVHQLNTAAPGNYTAAPTGNVAIPPPGFAASVPPPVAAVSQATVVPPTAVPAPAAFSTPPVAPSGQVSPPTGANLSPNGLPMPGPVPTRSNGTPIPLASSNVPAVPPVPAAPATIAPITEAPALVQQRNLVPAAPSVQNGQLPPTSEEIPWEQ
jgi:hypothetical protein